MITNSSFENITILNIYNLWDQSISTQMMSNLNIYYFNVNLFCVRTPSYSKRLMIKLKQKPSLKTVMPIFSTLHQLSF